MMKNSTIGRIILSVVIIGLLSWVVVDLWEQEVMHDMSCDELWLFGQEVKDNGVASRHAHVVAHYITDCTNG